jgi:Ran GTPase-activating protein (RanGAP) involved in mRNA processing and transport
MLPDISNSIEALGKALGENRRLEILNLGNNRIRAAPFVNFWALMKDNKKLQKINVSKTDLCDKTCEKLAEYLAQSGLSLRDLDLSKNQITDHGVKILGSSLALNKSLFHLNLDSNLI